MSGINNTGFTAAPIGAQMPRFLANNAAPAATGAPTMAQDQLNLVTGGAAPGIDPASIQQMLASPNVQDHYQAIINITYLAQAGQAPAAYQLLQQASSLNDPNLNQLIQKALPVVQQLMSQPAATQPGVTQPMMTQPTTTQPGMTFAPTAVAPTTAMNPLPGTSYAPTTAAAVQYTPPPMAQINPADAQFMMQTLQTDVQAGGDKAIAAIQQLAGLMQQNPALKQPIHDLLLNQVYNSHDRSVNEALKVLGSMNDPSLLPYLQMVQRDPGYGPDTQATALSLLQALSLNQGAQTASINGGNPAANVDFIRAEEFELNKGGSQGMAAFQQIRNALGPNPAQTASPQVRQEVIRVLLTHIAGYHDPSTMAAACQLLGQMGAREMDTLRYLDAVKRDIGKGPDAQAAAAAAITQIMQTPSNGVMTR